MDHLTCNPFLSIKTGGDFIKPESFFRCKPQIERAEKKEKLDRVEFNLYESFVLDGDVYFKEHQIVTSFKIDKLRSKAESEVEELIFDLDHLPQEPLNPNVDQHNLIKDYNSYWQIKLKHFTDTIIDLPMVLNATKSKPLFISFSGVIGQILQIPEKVDQMGDHKRTTLIVTKLGEAFYIKKKRPERRDPTTAGDTMGSSKFLDMKSILTGKNDFIDENEKNFNVNQVKFSDYQLLVLSEVDGVTKDGKPIKMAVKSPKRYFGKLIDMWSHCVINDMEKIILATHSEEGFTMRAIPSDFQSINREVQEECSGFRSLNATRSFSFLKFILDFIEEHGRDTRGEDLVIHIDPRYGHKLQISVGRVCPW